MSATYFTPNQTRKHITWLELWLLLISLAIAEDTPPSIDLLDKRSRLTREEEAMSGAGSSTVLPHLLEKPCEKFMGINKKKKGTLNQR